jgi:limonene 1,2-monooxygenase
MEVAVAAVASPTGPRLAGRYGVGLLSIGATMTEAGFDALAHHWNVMEEQAQTYGTTVDRSAWRLVGLMHVAETREQAYRDVEYGIEQWVHYFQDVAAFPQMAVEGGNLREMIDWVNTSGVGAIGTVEDAIAQVERLTNQSKGFGAMLLLAHEWANPAATQRSFELIAQHVIPAFQGQAHSTLAAKERAMATRPGYAEQQLTAVAHMTDKYAREHGRAPAGAAQ